MGNKLVGRRRQAVEEKYTKPQGLYLNKDVDIKKLRKLILESKLAPCYPGDDEGCHELEECPICFLYYPSLNRSRCCMKSICTECFLQMKNPNSARPTQCPFCKTPNYAVEYRGVKSKEEKGIEQVEEQLVIEAKIRMRQKEMQDDEEKMQKRLESCSSSTSAVTGEIEYGSASAMSYNSPMEDAETASSQNTSVRQRGNRDDVDLEELMVMEAIWLSIQETEMERSSGNGEIAPCSQYVSEEEPAMPSSCAISALAERQQMVGESSNHNHNHNVNVSSYAMLPGNCDSYYDVEQEVDDIDHHHNHYHNNTEMGETGSSSYVSSYMNGEGFHNFPPPPPMVIVPESFEEQMMMAMAVSLAEVHATTTSAPTEVMLTLWKACWGPESEREKMVEEAYDGLKYLEEELGDKQFFGGETIGFVDIAADFIAYWFGIAQEASGVMIMTAERFPKLQRWSQNFVRNNIIKEVLPPKEKLMALFKAQFGNNASNEA